MADRQLDAIKSSFLFQDMNDGEISSLFAVFKPLELAEGATVFVENMPGEALYLIQRGAVKISRMLGEGEEKILVVLGAEDVFGEMAVLDGAPRSATARIAENARLLSLQKGDFEALCETNPRLGLKLMRNIVRLVSRRLRENRDEYRKMLLWSLAKAP